MTNQNWFATQLRLWENLLFIQNVYDSDCHSESEPRWLILWRYTLASYDIVNSTVCLQLQHCFAVQPRGHRTHFWYSVICCRQGAGNQSENLSRIFGNCWCLAIVFFTRLLRFGGKIEDNAHGVSSFLARERFHSISLPRLYNLVGDHGYLALSQQSIEYFITKIKEHYANDLALECHASRLTSTIQLAMSVHAVKL